MASSSSSLSWRCRKALACCWASVPVASSGRSAHTSHWHTVLIMPVAGHLRASYGALGVSRVAAEAAALG
eukprot:CAMPEP_0185199010 /NCGR_PEP_ID=MMETSP1140-20130426/44157_1 /TAXON_ID=298111 /ORGANISM="Pavlova sp., Strain CCMP459" /LENGTH=69 /DNA_ID=CAMNT_0027766251 /DNA_START=109 /DNA_END=318 /DNA_ORIENTATION=+